LRSAQECEHLLQAARVPAHHVVNTTTAFSDLHLVARGMFVTTLHGDHEALVTSTGYHFSSVPASVGRVPAIGADTVSVLRDHLGYSTSRIDALMSSGVIVAHSASAEA
jgi:crotonobetainyl-CoA:carnitine CoA-transferase CaiB-like acyl-CoA transferase